MSIHLGVNIDHVATLRQVRGTKYPDPLLAALLAEQSGADSITLHLREDRRHIQDRDVKVFREALQTRMNLEMAATEAMLALAVATRPADSCLVPEKRNEVTTEGGLDVVANAAELEAACARLAAAGVRVSLFIDPDLRQLDAAARAGAPVVELHTGAYAEAEGGQQALELNRLIQAARHGVSLGLTVHAGHGLHYHNVQPVAAIREIVELNIGHAIVARAVFDGLPAAVREMKRLMIAGREGEMIFGIGTDVVQLTRMEAVFERHGEHLVRRLLLPAEEVLFRKTKRPVRFLAMHFAAKEAIVKAMGTGFAHGMWIRDAGFVPNEWGRPDIIWSERGLGMCEKLGVGEGHITLTDEAGLVVAVAVLMRREQRTGDSGQ